MKPLHKNTGKHEWHGTIGRLYWHCIIAEDPSLPWYFRAWESDQNGLRNQRIVGIERCYNDNESAIIVYIGPVMLGFCWLSV